MNYILRLRNWTMRLPSSWGLGHAEIHSSLLITLGVVSLMLLLLSNSRPGLEELMTVAVTLPVVWIVSLAVRVAAQQLVLSNQAQEAETVVGPNGNLSTDYEYLPPKQVLLYSLAGQLATAALVLLGFVVNAAMIRTADSDAITTAQLLDFKGGWGSDAWASQIMWVNLFLFGLNLLPTVPFDMRATLLSLFAVRRRTVQDPEVFRRVAGIVSHLAFFVLGAGLSTAILGWAINRDIIGWYAAIAAAVYLFVASQWEGSRAEELEEQYAPLAALNPAREATTNLIPEMSLEELVASAEPGSSSPSAGEPRTDIDEILRKLYREGAESLTPEEQEALLSASRELKEKRGL